jgi:hypothetical protein
MSSKKKHRVILHKTKYFDKGTSGSGGGNKTLARYLRRYVDEVGKAARGGKEKMAAGGKPPAHSGSSSGSGSAPNPLHSSLSRTKGKLVTGGFLGHEKSPGGTSPDAQRGWVRRVTEHWGNLLKTRNSRRNDGFRFVLSLSPTSLKEIKEGGADPDEVLLEIWKETMKLYRKRHGWESPKNNVGWICGHHHDTEKTHLHIILFPTTLSGLPIRTNNGRRVRDPKTKEVTRVNDLNDLIAMANIATEIIWRRTLPFHLQSPEYQRDIAADPTGEEPNLPSLEDYESPSGIRGVKPNPKPDSEEITNPDVPKPTHLTSQEKEIYNLVKAERGILATYKERAKSKLGLRILNAVAVISQTLSKRGIKPISVFMGLKDKAKEKATSEEILLALPNENRALKRLLDSKLKEKIKSKAAKKVLLEWERGKGWARAVMALSAGTASEPIPDLVLGVAKKQAEAYDAALETNPKETKLKATAALAKSCAKSAFEERQRESAYTVLLGAIRSLEKSSSLQKTPTLDLRDEKTLVSNLIRGSRRLSLFLQARVDEIQHSIKKTKSGFKTQEETREWKIDSDGIRAEENKGRPWPSYLDPERVLLPLESGNSPAIDELPKDPISLPKKESEDDPPRSLENNSPLEVLIDFRRKKKKTRRSRVDERIKQSPSDPTEELEGPSGP